METCLHTKKFPLKAQNLELAFDRCLHPRMTGKHKYAVCRSPLILWLTSAKETICHNIAMCIPSRKGSHVQRCHKIFLYLCHTAGTVPHNILILVATSNFPSFSHSSLFELHKTIKVSLESEKRGEYRTLRNIQISS